MDDTTPKYYSEMNIATEWAFNALRDGATKHGIPIAPTMGLMYIPQHDLIQKFQEVCREILTSLLPEGK